MLKLTDERLQIYTNTVTDNVLSTDKYRNLTCSRVMSARTAHAHGMGTVVERKEISIGAVTVSLFIDLVISDECRSIKGRVSRF